MSSNKLFPVACCVLPRENKNTHSAFPSRFLRLVWIQVTLLQLGMYSR